MRFALPALLALAAAPSGAQTLFEDEFAADAPRLNAELVHWTVSQGSVDVVTSCGRPCVDLDGSKPGSAPTVLTTRQSFRFEPGATYELSFEFPMGTNADPFTAGVAKSVRSYEAYDFPLSDAIRFTPGATGFEAPIVFTLDTPGNDNFGPYLGGVSLRMVSTGPAGRFRSP